MYNDFCSDFLLHNVIGFVGMQKAIIESCVDKTFSNRLSSSERCFSSLLHLLTALRRSLLRIEQAFLLESFGSLKIRNFRSTPSCLQFLRKSMSSFSLFYFFVFSKNFNCNIFRFPCNIVADICNLILKAQDLKLFG